jgi:VWFA-related protein
MLEPQPRSHRAMAAVAAAALAGVVVAPALVPVPSRTSAEGRPPQQTEQRPVFRGGAAFVAVDVYPRRDGRVVEGLTEADFEILEDGKPQAVETFELIRFDTALVDDERRDPTSAADSERQAADPRNRVFVVYLDQYHLKFDASLRVASTVMAFLTRTIGPTDLFATMTPKRPPSQLTFGRRLEMLEEDLREFWLDLQVGIDEVEFRLETCPEVTRAPAMEQRRVAEEIVARHRQDMLMTSLEGLMRRLGGLRDERKNVLLISEGWKPLAPNPELNEWTRPEVPRVGVSPRGRLGVGPQQPMERDVVWCAQRFDQLAQMDFEERFIAFVDRARESNVTFYPVDVGGLRAERGLPPGGVLRTLAENTDGTAVFSTNDVTGAVRRLTDSIAAYYLLGYYSTNTASDGKFRRIQVRVKRSDVEVSARRGYFAPTAAMVAAAAAPSPAPTPALDEALGRLARARSDVDLHAYAAHAGDRIDVVAELASRLLSGPAWRSGADVHVTARPAAGAPVEARARIEPGLRSTVVLVPVPPGDRGSWTIAVRATGGSDEQADATITAGSAPGPLFGHPMLYRANASPRAPLRAVADLQFRRTERIRVEYRALEPGIEPAVRLLDRQGQALPIRPTLSTREEGSATIVSVDLALAPLSEGEYVIELTGQRGADSQRALAAFRLVR